jgi:hypothetical protein
MSKVYPINVGVAVETKQEENESTSRPSLFTKDKQVDLVLKNVNEQLKETEVEVEWETKKFCYISMSVILFIIATMMFIFGLGDAGFLKAEKINPALLTFGLLFYFPTFYLFKILFFPNLENRRKRQEIYQKSKVRQKSALLQVFKDEEKGDDAEIFPDLLKIFGVVRGGNGRPKFILPMDVSNLYDFCCHIENETGLPIDQQIIKFNGQELDDIGVSFHDYGVRNNDILYVYNRGKYMASLMPKKQRESIVSSSIAYSKGSNIRSKQAALAKEMNEIASTYESTHNDNKMPQSVKKNVVTFTPMSVPNLGIGSRSVISEITEI